MPITPKTDNQSLLVGQETVTFRSVKNSGDDTIAVTMAVQYPVSAYEIAASNGAYLAGDVIWTIQSSQLASVTPKPRDVIVSAGGDYTILRKDPSAVAGFYKFTTRNLAIVYDLQNTGDIELPTTTKDAAGANVQTWSTVYSSLACRAQPVHTEPFSGRGVKSSEAKYDIFVGQNVTVTNSQGVFGRFKLNGVYLEITGYRNAERIDELPVIECVRKGGPIPASSTTSGTYSSVTDSSGVAVFHTSTAHHLVPGDIVTITALSENYAAGGYIVLAANLGTLTFSLAGVAFTDTDSGTWAKS